MGGGGMSCASHSVDDSQRCFDFLCSSLTEAIAWLNKLRVLWGLAWVVGFEPLKGVQVEFAKMTNVCHRDKTEP